MNPLRTLLENVIDYAGLFPPAALPMLKAVGNYTRYRASPESWMLGRFVVPVSRLDEFEACVGHAAPPLTSALIGGDLERDLHRIAQSGFPIDTIELKAEQAEQIFRVMRQIPPRLAAYFEISAVELVPALREMGARAKIRTGGTKPDAIPSADSVAALLAACAANNVAFKATAGLHHPLRCYRPLTYSADGPSAWMFGFLNILVAAVLARKGVGPEALKDVLLEASAGAFAFNDAQIEWSGNVMAAGEIADARREFAISFGSCSFEEPVEELKSLGLL